MGQLTKVEILQETAAFYNTDNRSVSQSNTNCLYKGDNGKECAFQRCVETDLSYCDKMKRQPTANRIIREHEIVFKPQYAGHGGNFWYDVQQLHDRFENWNKNGLSEAGKKKLEELTNKYK